MPYKMESKFKIGDRVVLRWDPSWLLIVTNVFDENLYAYPIKVKYPDGYTCGYNTNELLEANEPNDILMEML